MMKVNVNKYWC